MIIRPPATRRAAVSVMASTAPQPERKDAAAIRLPNVCDCPAQVTGAGVYL
jgi:hypothetical protein